MSSITDTFNAPSGPTGPSESTVPITLTTSLSAFAIPPGPYMVPHSWRRTHLSTLVNKLVASSSDPSSPSIPFDFIINSSLLRTSLGEFLETNGLTAESTLSIEYVRSTLPPTRLAAFEHDDWVSSVDCSRRGMYMTGSYDGSVRLFSPSNAAEAVCTFNTLSKASVNAGRNGGVTSAKWTETGEGLVTGGMDGKIQFFSVVEEEEGWRSGRKWQGEAHNGPISCVDVAQGPQGASVISGGWDGIVALWDDVPQSQVDGGHSDEEEEEPNKRRKTLNGRSTKSTSSKPGQLEPTMVLYHAQPLPHATTGAKNVFHPNSRVTSILFERSFSTSNDNPNRAWSCGLNGQLKGYDLSSGGTLHTSLTLPSNTAETRPILSLTHLAPSTLVTGAMDRGIHIFDIRSDPSSTNLGMAIGNAHRGPVDVVKAHPVSRYLFASGTSVEGGVKVWDSRSSKKALFSLAVEEGRGKKGEERGILGLDWTRDGQEIVAGGKDKRITVYRGSGIGVNGEIESL